MKKIIRMEPQEQALKPKKRVAAYARVSMESERLQHSLSAQISYYNEKIQKNPDWLFAGVYADDGISGTGTAKRDEFNRLIDDCNAGRIDLVLTKSISRFARNTVDLLETVRHLKDIGVEVWFERENIHSMDGDGEVMLSILASFAQEESRSISENVKWGTRKRFEKGIPNGHFRIYGYRWEGDELVPVPEEAAVVKRIFQNFLDGKSRLETEREFAAEGITTRSTLQTRSAKSERRTMGSCRSFSWKVHMSRSSIRKPSIMCRPRWSDGENLDRWQTSRSTSPALQARSSAKNAAKA